MAASRAWRRGRRGPRPWRSATIVRPLRRLWRPSSIVCIALLLAACQPRVLGRIDYPGDVRYAAAADSLSLADWLDLDDASRRARRREAAVWLDRSRDAASLDRVLQALHTAVGLDPAAAEAWLQLARLRRWYGDYQQTEDALAAGRAALPHQGGDRRGLAAEMALCEAWLRYDRGDWRRGLEAVGTAADRGADDESVDLLRALHLAGQGRDARARDLALRFAVRDHHAHWVYAVSYWRRGGVQAAHGIFTGTASDVAAGAADFVKGRMRPRGVGAAESYRDFGMVEELIGNWWLARRNYQLAAGALPWRDENVLRRVDHPILARERDAPDMPVWLAFDRYYVTGSLSAFTALAMARYLSADHPAARESWAAAVLDAAGICVRLDIDAAWARRNRGLVLADFAGRQAQARQDLEAAQRWFESRRIEDLQTLTGLARVHLALSRPDRAEPLLERALRLAPGRARLWSDLGLARLHLDAPSEALSALTRALQLDATLAAAWYNRGLLRYRLDDLDGAVADLEEAYALAPDDPMIVKLLEQLRGMLRDGQRR